MDESKTVGGLDPLAKGDRIPAATLAGQPRGEPRNLRGSRGPRVFVTLHDAECSECVGYVEGIASISHAVKEWGADIVVVIPEAAAADDGTLAGLDLPILTDPGRVLARDRLTVVIADEWGEIHFASEPGPVHGPLAPDEVLEWVKFVSIQCPECEGPEGPWRDL